MKRRALKVVKRKRDLIEHTIRVRSRILHLLKEEDYPPEAAFSLFAGLVGMLGASQRQGRWRLLYNVWKTYSAERNQLLVMQAREIGLLK